MDCTSYDNEFEIEFNLQSNVMTEETLSILIVDDDEILRTRLSRAFRNRGFDVMEAENYDSAITTLQDTKPDRAVLDLKMPGNSGMELLKELKRISPETEAIVLTGYGSITNAVNAIKLGAVNYVTKPADAEEILAAFSNPEPDQLPADAESISTRSLAEAEWEHIHRVLADCGGNISEAARRLDIPRRTLQRKLKKLSP